MTQRKQIEVFNHHLDTLLHGDEASPESLPDVERQALGIARHLAALDLSAQSKVRYPLRRQLAQNARLRSQKTLGHVQIRSLQPSAALAIALPSATLLFVLVFVLGWTFTNLSLSPASGGLVSTTASAMPGAVIESSLPPGENNPVLQAYAPQPLPTPIAPRQSSTYAPSTFSPDQTPSQTSPRAGLIGLTQVSP